MHGVHIGNMDLNLLVALDALLTERSVTRAASRVALSQSAMSHALSRIREIFGDPILVRTAEGMVPTERALDLGPKLRKALGELEGAISGGAPFDPMTSTRSFSIATSDYGELVLLPPLFARLRKVAPNVDIWVKPVVDDFPMPLATGEIELAIAPVRTHEQNAPGLRHEPLFDERFLCVMRRGHPLAKQRMTLARFVSYPHALVAPRGLRGSFVDDVLATLGKSRRIACAVPHFLVAPHVVARSDLLLTAAERVFTTLAPHLGLVSVPMPVPITGFTLSQMWHERSEQDPGLSWLRGLLREIAAEC
jgi:DNA-binding transcriptional LysR family regulator